jgi:Cu-Zn family superoxide dismutase
VAAIEGVTLSTGDATDLLGKTMVVHERADDYRARPDGNSGRRVACGVIAVARDQLPPGPG